MTSRSKGNPCGASMSVSTTPLRPARETRVMIRDLAPLLGRRLSFGVVPNWHGEWPLAAHPDYCRLVREGAEELLLHGYFHQRQRGRGPIALFAESCDEMNGLDLDRTPLGRVGA